MCLDRSSSQTKKGKNNYIFGCFRRFDTQLNVCKNRAQRCGLEDYARIYTKNYYELQYRTIYQPSKITGLDNIMRQTVG